MHDPYFEPKCEEFRPRTIWSLSHAFTSVLKEMDPIPQFKALVKLAGRVPGNAAVLTVVLDRCDGVGLTATPDQLLVPDRAVPGRSNSCSAGVKACVRINSVLTREVNPDAAKIIARTTNW